MLRILYIHIYIHMPFALRDRSIAHRAKCFCLISVLLLIMMICLTYASFKQTFTRHTTSSHIACNRIMHMRSIHDHIRLRECVWSIDRFASRGAAWCWSMINKCSRLVRFDRKSRGLTSNENMGDIFICHGFDWHDVHNILYLSKRVIGRPGRCGWWWCVWVWWWWN